MANSTFSGPVRSQNGFQEWNGTAWVPVAGGGGGGSTTIPLYGSSSVYGNDNKYSDDSAQDPPTGPTAGNIIQLPVIDVGASYKVIGVVGGYSYSCWALQLPTIDGTDLSAFSSNALQSIQTASSGGYPVYTGNNSFLAYSSISSPSDTIFIYGRLSPVNALEITRLPNITAPGFGTIAIFSPTSAATFEYYDPAPDHFVYPYTQLLPAP